MEAYNQIKIIIIDDESSIRESFAYYLEDRDFEVHLAENGQMGVDLIDKEKPDLVLSDLRMPELDGLQVLSYCSKSYPDMPVIVISGANTIDEAVEALRRGAWDYLMKPVKDLSILEHAVDKVLERARLLKENKAHQEHLEVLVNERTVELQDAFEALKASEEKYRSLFERSNDAILIVEKKTGQIKDANDAAINMTARSLDELSTMTIKDIGRIEIDEQISEVLKSNIAEDIGQVNYLRPDGKNRVAMVTLVPMDADFVIVIARDITRNLEMEEQLRQAQKMEAIGTLAGGIAHDFNNILSAILGYSELSLLALEPGHPVRNKLDAICRSGERARELVAQILAFSRSDKQVISSVRIDIILKEALKILRPAIPATITIDLRIKSKCSVTGDPTRLHQIIMNLCTNANQAMSESGGTLGIYLGQIDIDIAEAERLDLLPATYVKLEVTDNGSGIQAQEMNRIFEPYYTTKEKGKGTGMGLAVVHGIVKSHGGSITVKSSVGEGTHFSVYFPLSPETSKEEKRVVEPVPAGRERLLVIDDEKDIVEIEEEILVKLGYTVIATTKPDEAIALFEKDPGRFDLIISDMTMPKITGINLAKKVKEINPDVKIIICSGYNEQITSLNSREKGVDGYISKPVTMSELAETVRSVLDQTD